jgi:hypothetical protein
MLLTREGRLQKKRSLYMLWLCQAAFWTVPLGCRSLEIMGVKRDNFTIDSFMLFEHVRVYVVAIAWRIRFGCI